MVIMGAGSFVRDLARFGWPIGPLAGVAGNGRWPRPLSGRACLAGSGSRELVWALGGERAAHDDDGKPEHVPPGRALVRSAALASGAGQRAMLGPAVHVGDAVTADLVADSGVPLLVVDSGAHPGLPGIWLDFRCQLRAGF